MLSAFSAPLDSVTLGSFTFVTNIFAPLAVVVALPGFKISGVFSPVIGIVVLTVWSVMLTKTIHDR
jgi:putative membrane protein